MSMKYRSGIAAVALALGFTAGLAAQQPAHQGHEMKPGQGHQMAMPALDDAHFAAMISKHHQQGIELSKIEESKGTRSEVKSLAAKIRAGQERDLKALEGGAHADHSKAGSGMGTQARGTAGHGTDDASMQKHHEMMAQMASESKQRLESASGAALDQAFLQEMTIHHQMAIEMIRKAKLKDANLRKLAEKMATEQKREMADLKRLQSSTR